MTDLYAEEADNLTRKRKLLAPTTGGPLAPPPPPPDGPSALAGGGKRVKGSPAFVPELAHLVAMCADKLPLVALVAEVSSLLLCFFFFFFFFFCIFDYRPIC